MTEKDHALPDKQDASDDDPNLLVMRNILDAQLETREHRRVGRVAGVEATWQENGHLVLTNLVTGPQTLTRRIWPRLNPLAHFIFRDRFETRISLDEVEDFGPTIHLRGSQQDYRVGHSEQWLVEHILRWLPGNGRER